MIIIAENKEQYYLIESFLKRIKETCLAESKEEKHANIHRAFDPNSIFKNKKIKPNSKVSVKVLEKASIEKPKMKNLVKLAVAGITISMLAASSYFASDMKNDEVAKIISDSNSNISVEQVSKEISSQATVDTFSNFDDNFKDNKLKLTANESSLNFSRKNREYDGKNITMSTHPNSLYNFEGFESEPYLDSGGISIGHGTQLFKNAKKRGGKTWQQVFFNEKLNLNLSLAKLSKIKRITAKQAKNAADRDIQKRIDMMQEIYSWSIYLPGDTQLTLLDMTYNMGMWFNMSGFKGNLEKAAKCINSGDFKMAIRYLETSKQELKYHTTPEAIKYEDTDEKLKYSAYALQGKESKPVEGNKIHRRPQWALDNIDRGISILNKHIHSEGTNESRSLKSVYTHLFS